MEAYNSKKFTKKVRELINKKISADKSLNNYQKEYTQEHLKMCVAIGAPDSFLRDVEEYEQRPKTEIVEKMATYFSVRSNYLLYGE